jgi:hypothetical protein
MDYWSIHVSSTGPLRLVAHCNEPGKQPSVVAHYEEPGAFLIRAPRLLKCSRPTGYTLFITGAGLVVDGYSRQVAMVNLPKPMGTVDIHVIRKQPPTVVGPDDADGPDQLAPAAEPNPLAPADGLSLLASIATGMQTRSKRRRTGQ